MSNRDGEQDGFIDYNAELEKKKKALMNDFKTESFHQPDEGSEMQMQRFDE